MWVLRLYIHMYTAHTSNVGTMLYMYIHSTHQQIGYYRYIISHIDVVLMADL